MEDLMIKVNQTYSVDGNTPVNFNAEFRAQVKVVYYEIFKKTGLGQHFD